MLSDFWQRPLAAPGRAHPAAMIDRLVHHADVIALKGNSYRLKDRDPGRVPTPAADEP
jgi:DNA replication protein DnaC